MVSGEKFVIVSTERLLEVYFSMELQLVLSFKMLFCSIFILFSVSFNIYFYVLCQAIERPFLYSLLIFFIFYIWLIWTSNSVAFLREKKEKESIYSLWSQASTSFWNSIVVYKQRRTSRTSACRDGWGQRSNVLWSKDCWGVIIGSMIIKLKQTFCFHVWGKNPLPIWLA